MEGLIFIPDISGFTNFVKSIDIDLGVSITRDLLNEIIDNNPLDLELSEIEGDAVLFYKIGKPIPVQQILNCFNNMYEAFDTRFQQWKLSYNVDADLSLKLIVHYGNIIVYDIKGFTKLYGEAVIDSHTLLKNGSSAPDYILITEDYMKALHQNISHALVEHERPVHVSHLSSGVKRIAYHFFSTIKKASAISNMVSHKENKLKNNMYLAVGT
jgi:hypothetical protein